MTSLGLIGLGEGWTKGAFCARCSRAAAWGVPPNPAPRLLPLVQWLWAKARGYGVSTLGEVSTRNQNVQESPCLGKSKASKSVWRGYHGHPTEIRNKRGCVPCPALPHRIPGDWRKPGSIPEGYELSRSAQRHASRKNTAEKNGSLPQPRGGPRGVSL